MFVFSSALPNSRLDKPWIGTEVTIENQGLIWKLQKNADPEKAHYCKKYALKHLAHIIVSSKLQDENEKKQEIKMPMWTATA